MTAPGEHPENRDDRRAVWSRYWAGGALHSCGSSFDGNYSGDFSTGVLGAPTPPALGVGGSGLRAGDLIFQYLDQNFGVRL